MLMPSAMAITSAAVAGSSSGISMQFALLIAIVFGVAMLLAFAHMVAAAMQAIIETFVAAFRMMVGVTVCVLLVLVITRARGYGA
jgi:hypothetical protein